MIQMQQTQNFLLKKHYEPSVAPITSSESKPISSSNVLNKDCPNPAMIHFLFMNIAHLISKTKCKLKFLADICDAITIFLFFEIFLHDGTGNYEIQIPKFSINRCDHLFRVGGSVCIYLRKYVNFTTCVNYSNSVCELLILKLHSPTLIVILMYRPPSCTINEFEDIMTKVNQFIFSLCSPLPNSIILGDFNFPGVNWSIPNFPP